MFDELTIWIKNRDQSILPAKFLGSKEQNAGIIGAKQTQELKLFATMLNHNGILNKINNFCGCSVIVISQKYGFILQL